MASGSFKFFRAHSRRSFHSVWIRLSVVASSFSARVGEGGELQQYLHPLRKCIKIPNKVLRCSSFIILSLCCFTGLSQDLETTIYNELDHFVDNASEENLKNLVASEFEFQNQVTSKEEKLALVILDCNIAFYQQKYSHLQKAISYYEKAWRLFQNNQLQNYDITEYCLKPLGNLYTITGAFTNAETTIKQYLFLAEKKNDITQEIAGIVNLSVVYHNTGNYNTAIGILRKGLNNKNLTKSQITALENNLVTNYFAAGKLKEAENLVLQRIKNGSATYNTYKNAAQLAIQSKDYASAEKYLQKGEQKMIVQKDLRARDLAKLQTEKADLYLLQNKPNLAEQHYRLALQLLLPSGKSGEIPLTIDLYAENTFLTIFDGLARLSPTVEKALIYYDLSFFVAKLLEKRLDSQQSKILHQIDNRTRSETCIELLYESYKVSTDLNILQKAFTYAEKSKASVLTEAQEKRSLLEKYPKDPLLKKEQMLASSQEGLINDLVRAQLSALDSQQINDMTSVLNELHLELNTVRNEISNKYPENIEVILSFEELQTKLQNDKASMQYYFFGKKNVYRFDISSEKVAVVQIELSESFLTTLSAYIAFFENASDINSDILNFKETSNLLYTSLGLPSNFSEKKLVVIPDGLLNFVSFEALITTINDSSNFNDMPFLIRTQKIGYETTAGFYVRDKTPATITVQNEKSVLGIFPVFDGTSKELRFSVQEANDLDQLMSCELLMNDRATKTAFIEIASNYDFLHLSTHASGGDFVIPANIEFADDIMLLHELYSMQLQSKLVVLSACETGVGKLQRGEGAMSIARGFKFAGAQNLLFSLWKVNDLATSQLMDSFYKYFRKSGSAFEATHASKIEYLDNPDINNAKKSPYYWSSFVYYGTLSEIMKPEVESTRFTQLTILLGLGFLLFLIIVLLNKIKK